VYHFFKLMCHPELMPETHLSPELYSSLLDVPCESLESFNECVSVHSDMGLLTVSPHSNLPKLTVLKHSDATRWVNVEMKPGSLCMDGSNLEKNYVFVFAGETMAQLTKGYLLAPLHFVDERTPTQPPFSMLFFLRARQHLLKWSLKCLCLSSTAGTDSTSAASGMHSSGNEDGASLSSNTGEISKP
jgi:isopenicillin N synthase-like dioxygenase